MYVLQKPFFTPMNPQNYYNSRIKETSTLLSKQKKKTFLFSMLRLSTFVGTTLITYLFFENSMLVGISFTVGLILFLKLVSKSSDLKAQITYLKKSLELNALEVQVLEGDLSQISNGSTYIFEGHKYNQDIDLFGQGSLFQLINRTETKKGEELLAFWLNENHIKGIQQKQEANKELCKKAVFRHHFKTTAAIVEGESDSEPILNWLSHYKPYLPPITKHLPAVFSLISIGLIAAYTMHLISGGIILLWLMLGLTIVGTFVKKTSALYYRATKVQDTLSQYAALLKIIERESFESTLLKAQREKIYFNETPASTKLKALTKDISNLGNRNNIFLTPIINGFFLWDIIFGRRIESWIQENAKQVKDWFDVIEYFDAKNSMATLTFNNPSYIYPTISNDESKKLVAEKLGHPLLLKGDLVSNNITINSTDFFIITGANMAGKSTFLRTVALNLVMANCGLPVWAKSYVYNPCKVISSMRTSDSLQNAESYFFSELKRLKFIVDALKTDDYFVILDEILKGTNSKDKAEGSQQFLEKLIASKSTGLIATHDLSLCELSKTHPEIKNYYFDAQIIDDELFFDYKIKLGVCQNMNASFLLRKMEIV